MLIGKLVSLRPVQEDDLDLLYLHHTDIDNRGDFFPRGVQGQPSFRNAFQETGFWGTNEGMLVIVGQDDRIIGHIEYYSTVNYLDELELSYHVYEPEFRGKGVATEAVTMLVQYLFATRSVNRIRLIIHPDNLPSRRLAERCGFRHEGTARGAWYHNGRHHDVEVYAVLHEDILGQ